MSRYRFEWTTSEGEQVARLRDDLAEAEADIVTSFGMNVVRLVSQGDDIVLQPPSLTALRATPFRYGIAMLSPPGRTSHGELPFRGATYRLPLTAGKHHMHGAIGAVPWRETRWGADDEEGAFLEAEYTYRSDPERFAYFPFDLRYSVTYRLKDGTLSLEGAVRNEGREFAPFALGYHPYFVCGRKHAALRIPARAQWTMDRERGAFQLPEPTRLSAALRDGMELEALEGGLHFFQCRDFESEREEAYTCLLTDRAAKRRVRYRADGLFSVMALFVPTWGEAISLEPHSCIPDAWNLPWSASETGRLELSPGEERRFAWSVEAEKEATERGGEER